MNANKIPTIMLLLLFFIAGCETASDANGQVSLTDMVSDSESQVVMIGLKGGYYTFTPDEVLVDKPAILRNDGSLRGCAMYVVQKDLGINADFSKTKEISFVPREKGIYTFACTMNMFKGTLKVI